MPILSPASGTKGGSPEVAKALHFMVKRVWLFCAIFRYLAKYCWANISVNSKLIKNRDHLFFQLCFSLRPLG